MTCRDSHHFACACREAKVAELVAAAGDYLRAGTTRAQERLRAALDALK